MTREIWSQNKKKNRQLAIVAPQYYRRRYDA